MGERKKPGCANLGYSFEAQVAEMVSLRLALDETVKDFSICSNPEKHGVFEDIVIKIEYAAETVAYGIQCKHKQQQTLNFGDFENEKDKDFSLQKYQESFNTFTSNNNAFAGVDLDHVYFVIYTNAKIKRGINICYDEGHFIKARHFKGHIDFLKASEDTDILQFLDKRNKYQSDFLSKLIIMVGQKSGSQMENNIFEHIKVKLDTRITDNVIIVLRDFFKGWVENRRLIKFNKMDIQAKLLECMVPIFDIFQAPDDKMRHSPDDGRRSVLLIKTLLEFNVTGISDISVGQVSCSVRRTLENILQTSLSNVEMSTQIGQGMVDRIYNGQMQAIAEISAQLKDSVFLPSQLTFKSIYLAAWRCKMVPIILDVNDIVFPLVKLNNLLDELNFVIIGNNLPLDKVKFFENIVQLRKTNKDLYKEALDEFSLSFQGKEHISLRKFEKDNILQQITPDVYIKLLKGTMMIGSGIQTEEIYVERNLLYAEFDVTMSIQAGLCDEIIILTNTSECLKGSSEFSLENRSSCQFTPNSFDETIREKVNHLHNDTDKAIHVFERGDNIFHWVYSVGVTNSWRQFVNMTTMRESELQKLTSNTIMNIIVGGAGAGKTTLLKSIGEKCTKDNFVSFVSVRRHVPFIKNIINKKAIWELVLNVESIDEILKEFLTQILILCNENRSLILILDDIDALSSDDIVNLRELLIKFNGIKVWVSTSFDKCRYIEKYFYIQSLQIEPLTIVKSKEVLRYYMNKSRVCLDKLGSYRKFLKLLEISDLGDSPLVINMLANALLNYQINYDCSIAQIYKLFIENEISAIYEKSKVKNAKEILSQLALKTFFPKDFLESNNLINLPEDKNYIENLFQGNKIITSIDENGIACFCQKSYAEFLAGQLIAEKIMAKQDNWKVVHSKLFSRELLPVRRMFDYVVSDRYALHRAVLDRCNINELEIIHQKRDIEKDSLGRTALHLAASYGSIYNFDNIANDRVGTSEEKWKVLQNVNRVMQLGEYNAYIVFQLLVRFKFKNRKDKILGYDVYDYALRSGCLRNLDFIYTKSNKKKLPLWETADTSQLLFYIVRDNFHNILSTRKNFGIDNIDKGEWKCKKLFRNKDLFNATYDGMSLLQIAVYQGNEEILQLLLLSKSVELDMNLENLAIEDSTKELIKKIKSSLENHKSKKCCSCCFPCLQSNVNRNMSSSSLNIK